MCSSFLHIAPGIEIFRNVVDGLLVVLLGPQTMGCRADCDKSESVFAQSCLTLCNCMGYSPLSVGFSRILEWVAIPFSRGSS